jgi:hypothetical protein
MTERRPAVPPSAPPDSSAWDLPAVAGALGTPGAPHHDPTHGEGVAFRLGTVRPLDLELFPDAGVVRLTGGDVQVSLLRQPQGPRLAPEGLVFELPATSDGRFLSVSPTGEVTLFLVPDVIGDPVPDDPRMARFGPQDAPSTAVDTPTTPTVETASSGAPGASEGLAAPSMPPPTDATATTERDYVPRLTGRLARNPRFHENKQGVLVAEFDLGVKDPDDPSKTTWYALAVFGERAEKLKGAVKQGDLVDVIGSYKHVREYTGRDGQRRRKEQWYPTVVKLR